MKDEEQTVNSKYRNYIILLVIFCLFGGLVLYLCEWYKVYDDSKKEIPIIRDTLFEIVPEELEHIIIENQNKVVYMCIADADVCRNFEKDFVKYLNKKDYKDEIVYLNLTNVNQDEFVNNFNSTYNYKKKLTTDYPAFVVFKDGVIDSILQGNTENPLSISKLNSFLELNQIGE